MNAACTHGKSLLMMATGVGAGLALAAVLGAAPPPTGSVERAKWEYGEFAVFGERAIIVGATSVQEMVLPDKWYQNTPVITYENFAGKFEKRRIARLYFCDVIGRDGWEIISQGPIEEEQVYQVRRELRTK